MGVKNVDDFSTPLIAKDHWITYNPIQSNDIFSVADAVFYEGRAFYKNILFVNDKLFEIYCGCFMMYISFAALTL